MYRRNKRAAIIAAFLLAAFQIVADPLDHWTLGNVGAPVVLRAITGQETVDEYLALLRAAKPA